jgi:diguanylate cyclase (GGDEF)-like protein
MVGRPRLAPKARKRHHPSAASNDKALPDFMAAESDTCGKRSGRMVARAGRIAAAVLALLTACAVCLQARANNTQRWSAYTETLFGTVDAADGLPNLTVNAITQDKEGFIWAGTPDGVGRWDGQHFRTYRSDPDTPGSMIGTQVYELHTDRQGEIWAGSSAGELAHFDRAQNRFVVVSDGTSLHNDDVNVIIDDGEGGLWLGRDSSLYHLAMGSQHPDQRPAAGHDPRALPRGTVQDLLLHQDGALWAATTAGVFRQARGSHAFVAVTLPGSGAAAVTSLLQDHTGRVWAGTQGSGTYEVSADGSAAHAISGAISFQTADVESLAEAPNGRIWVATNGAGIFSIDPDTEQITHMRHRSSHPASLADDTVQQVFRGRAGLMWAATDNGLSHTYGQEDSILTVFSDQLWHGQADSAPDVTTVLPLPDGRILLGTRQNWLAMVDPYAAPSPAKPPDSRLPARIVRSVALTPQGQILIASPVGLFRADRDGQSVVEIPPRPGGKPWSLLSVTRIGDEYWLACIDGLWRLDAASADLPPVSLAAAIQRDPSSLKLQDLRGRVVAPGPNGKIWVGTYTGLNLVDPVTHSVQTVPEDPADPDGLPEGMISTLLTDRQGRLWVGTEGGGIAVMTGFEGGRMRFHHLGRKDGLPDQVIDELLQDKESAIWVSTDDGIARIDPATFSVRSFGQADGVAIQVYWANAGAVTEQGDLLFGGSDGLTVIRPDRLTQLAVKPPLVVTDLIVGGVPEPGFPARQPGANHPVVIAPDRNSLEVGFTALDYADSSRYTYAHFLDGVDHGWVTTEPDARLAAYTNIPPGKFTLELRAVRQVDGGDRGQSVEAVLSLPVVVERAWYETRFFEAAILILSATTLALTLRVQAVLARRRRRELEGLIGQRTSELAIAADTLRELGTIGQEITASLDNQTLFAVLHRHVVGLCDAPLMAVHSISGPDEILSLRFGMCDGKPVAPQTALEAGLTALIMRAARQRKDMIGDVASLAGDGDGGFATVLAAPLIVKGQITGTMTIGSHARRAYGDRECQIVRTLAAYAAIALANADTLAQLGRAQAQLQLLAYSDGLTGLPNRRVFEQQFNLFAAAGQDADRCFALVLVDLDHFKGINDSYGHDAGDALLLETARRLRLAVREGDIVTRLGGDEFAILLIGMDESADLEAACDRLLAALSFKMALGDAVVDVTASIGVAIHRQDGDDLTTLYKAADTALYDAKKAGRGAWRIYQRPEAKIH